MPRIASITTQAFTGIAIAGGLKQIEDFAQVNSATASGVTASTGVHIGANGTNLQVTGDGEIDQFTLPNPFSMTALNTDDTFDPTANAGGAATTGGINWDASGRNFYHCAASQIEQYSVLTGDEYSITNRLAVAPNSLSVSGAVNLQMSPDDVTVLIAFGNQIVEYQIDPFYVRNIQFASATTDTLSIANCVGCAYYDDGNSLLVAQSTGTVRQYELTTAYALSGGATETSTLSTGISNLSGISAQGTNLFLVNNSGTVYHWR
jgi:hypothetical protein